MWLDLILGSLTALSLGLMVWQWAAARRFPLHRRGEDRGYAPGVTLLKPLKGCDAETASCLKSWLDQTYAGPVQVLLGVESANDPAAGLISELLRAYPRCDAQLLICPKDLGANSKVSKLIQLEAVARHEVLIVSDADVRVPPDFLAEVVRPLRDRQVGLVNCFYRLANPTTLPMQWEAIAVNADFWSQVLQARSLGPLDFALGAVMALSKPALAAAGGFSALADYLADDFQLGQRIAQAGFRIELCPVVVECRESPRTWRQVWAHQLRWARTIRVCRPWPYFFSVLSNVTLWPLLWVLWAQGQLAATDLVGRTLAGAPASTLPRLALPALLLSLAVRILSALDLQGRLAPSGPHRSYWWLVPLRDLLGAVIWLLALVGRNIDWRGKRYRLRPDGRLERR